MKDLLVLLAHLLTTIAKLLGPGGAKAILDYTLFWNAVDLERKLALFKEYYNHSRTHASLDGNTPAAINGDGVALPVSLHSYAWEKHCGGLFQLPVAA